MPLPDAADTESKLAEQIAVYNDNVEDLNQWFSLFGNLTEVKADLAPEMVADSVSQSVERCILQREARLLQVQEAEKQQKAVIAAEEARRSPTLEAVSTTKLAEPLSPSHRPPSSSSKRSSVVRESSASRRPSILVFDVPAADAKALQMVPSQKQLIAVQQSSPLSSDPLEISSFTVLHDVDLARLLAAQWIKMERQFTARSRAIFRALRAEHDANLTYFATTRRNFFHFLRRPNKAREDLLHTFQVSFSIFILVPFLYI